MKALFDAIKKADVDEVKLQLAGIQDINACFGVDTPLTRAAQSGETAVIQALLDAGADPAVANAKGKLAEDLAMSRGHAAAWQMLNKAGSKPDNESSVLLKAVIDNLCRRCGTGLPFSEQIRLVHDAMQELPELRAVMDAGELRDSRETWKLAWGDLSRIQNVYDIAFGCGVPTASYGSGIAVEALTSGLPMKDRDGLIKSVLVGDMVALSQKDQAQWLHLVPEATRHALISNWAGCYNHSNHPDYVPFMRGVTDPQLGSLPRLGWAPMGILASGDPVLLERMKSMVNLDDVILSSLEREPRFVAYIDTLLAMGAKMPSPDEVHGLFVRHYLNVGMLAKDDVRLQLIGWMSQHGADLNRRMADGVSTPLDVLLSALADNPTHYVDFRMQMVQALLALGGTHAPDKDVVAIACKTWHHKIVAVLQQLPDGVDSLTHAGQTALMLAARRGATQLVGSLLEAGADPRLEHKGKNALAQLAHAPAKSGHQIQSKQTCAALLAEAMQKAAPARSTPRM